MHTPVGRRRFPRESSAAAAGPTGLQSVHLAGFAQQRISRYDLIRTRVPIDERVREAWQRSFFQQGCFQTHYEPVIIGLFTDDGLAGSEASCSQFTISSARQQAYLLQSSSRHRPRTASSNPGGANASLRTPWLQRRSEGQTSGTGLIRTTGCSD